MPNPPNLRGTLSMTYIDWKARRRNSLHRTIQSRNRRVSHSSCRFRKSTTFLLFPRPWPMTGTVALLRDAVICLPCLVTSVGEVAAVHGYTVTHISSMKISLVWVATEYTFSTLFGMMYPYDRRRHITLHCGSVRL